MWDIPFFYGFAAPSHLFFRSNNDDNDEKKCPNIIILRGYSVRM